jgi:hypothetical protein
MMKSGISQMLRRRAKQAGIGNVHPHQFRHTFAHSWLAKSGTEAVSLELRSMVRKVELRRWIDVGYVGIALVPGLQRLQRERACPAVHRDCELVEEPDPDRAGWPTAAPIGE